MRLFIAIEFDSAVKNEIVQVSKALFEGAISGRPSRSENLHLTLAFLGEQPQQKIFAIRKCMEKACGGVFEMEFTQLGCFRRRDGEIWFIGVNRSQELAALEYSLRTALISQGFSVEDREFKPHITLGREIKLRPDFDRNHIVIPKQTWRVRELVLMESARDKGRLVYVPRIKTPL